MHNKPKIPLPTKNKIKSLKLSITSAAVAAALCSPPIALAQDDGPAIEEIIVTTRFREERLQEIPLAISAITA